jgi:hypothetical protein
MYNILKPYDLTGNIGCGSVVLVYSVIKNDVPRIFDSMRELCVALFSLDQLAA